MAEQVGHALRDGQAQPESLATRSAAAAELLEDQLLLAGRNAGAGVPHFHAQLIAGSTHAEQHAAVFGVAQRV